MNILGLTRRQMLARMGSGFGALGLASVLAENNLLAGTAAANDGPLSPRSPHFAPRAKRVIFLFMNGGPSQVDTFDPKPSLEKYAGQRPGQLNVTSERKTGGLMPSPFKFS